MLRLLVSIMTFDGQLPLPLLLTFLAMVCGSGLAWVLAGFRYMAGRWWQAICLNLAPLLLIPFVPAVVEIIKTHAMKP